MTKQSYPQKISDEGPVSYWRLNEPGLSFVFASRRATVRSKARRALIRWATFPVLRTVSVETITKTPDDAEAQHIVLVRKWWWPPGATRYYLQGLAVGRDRKLRAWMRRRTRVALSGGWTVAFPGIATELAIYNQSLSLEDARSHYGTLDND